MLTEDKSVCGAIHREDVANLICDALFSTKAVDKVGQQQFWWFRRSRCRHVEGWGFVPASDLKSIVISLLTSCVTQNQLPLQLSLTDKVTHERLLQAASGAAFPDVTLRIGIESETCVDACRCFQQ